MRPTLLFYSVTICLTPDDFTRQGESAVIQWVKQEQKCCSLFGYKIKPIVIGIVVVTVFQYLYWHVIYCVQVFI
jgi:hypothetical protein